MLIRLLTAFVVLTVIGFLVWIPMLDVFFIVCVAAMAGIGLYEYHAMIRGGRISPDAVAGIVAGVAVTLCGCFGHWPVIAAAFYGGCLLVCFVRIVQGNPALPGLPAVVFGVVYLGWFPAHMVMLHRIPGTGPGLVTLLIAAVGLSDAAAYIAGSAIGRHKMAPAISPNKSWEGALAGLLAAMLGMAVFYLISHAYGWRSYPAWSLPRYLATGAVLSVVGQIGDLVESCLKRVSGVKDSGSFFPGHGGVLDRCDGFLFAAPVMYYMVSLVWYFQGV